MSHRWQRGPTDVDTPLRLIDPWGDLPTADKNGQSERSRCQAQDDDQLTLAARQESVLVTETHQPRNQQDCRPDRANAVRAGAAVAFLRSRRARCLMLPRLRLRCSGNRLCDLVPAYVHNPGQSAQDVRDSGNNANASSIRRLNGS